jgi:hypothetical protein
LIEKIYRHDVDERDIFFDKPMLAGATSWKIEPGSLMAAWPA